MQRILSSNTLGLEHDGKGTGPCLHCQRLEHGSANEAKDQGGVFRHRCHT